MTAVGERSVLSKILATLAAVALAIILGAVDYLTGREWAISALYLLPTCLAGWVAGRLAGFALGALCTGVWFLSDMLNGAAYHHPLIPAWNAVMLFVFFFVVVYLLTAFRRSHDHLEQTVAPNGRAAGGDGRTKTAGTRQAPGGASRCSRINGSPGRA